MKRALLIALSLFLLSGCGKDPAPLPVAEHEPKPAEVPEPTVDSEPPVAAPAPLAKPGSKLVLARRGFKSKLVNRQLAADPVPEPPAQIFQLIRYDSPVGKLAAYLSPDPGDGKKHPAIVWITGGDCNSIGELWEPAPRNNDQTAAAYRKGGIIMMFPSMRGGNTNPGQREGYLGEVDDILAATDYLARQPYVDSERIYLGGHSTGGTMVMMVAESTDRFRAVFSFGPASDVRGYGDEYLPFDTSNNREAYLRSPKYWLDSVTKPLFVLEGTEQGNVDSLREMAKISKNPLIHFLPVPGTTHFAILAPMNDLIASKILKDEGPTSNIMFTDEEGALDR